MRSHICARVATRIAAQPDSPQPVTLGCTCCMRLPNMLAGDSPPSDYGAAAGPATLSDEFCVETGVFEHLGHQPPRRHASEFSLLKSRIGRFDLGEYNCRKSEQDKNMAHEVLSSFIELQPAPGERNSPNLASLFHVRLKQKLSRRSPRGNALQFLYTHRAPG